MKTLLVLPERPEKLIDTASLPNDIVEKIEAIFSYLYGAGQRKNKRHPYTRFYKVLTNDTVVTEVLVNDLKNVKPIYHKIKAACDRHSVINPELSLPANGEMFHGFLSRCEAMEFAKAGALKYINELIAGGEATHERLLQYREAHYEDLNFNLTDRSIKNVMGVTQQ